jgi:hypothetical protein
MSSILTLSPLRRGPQYLGRINATKETFSLSRPFGYGTASGGGGGCSSFPVPSFSVRMFCLSSRIGRRSCTTSNGPTSGILILRQFINGNRSIFTSVMRTTKAEIIKVSESQEIARPKASKKEFKRLLGLAKNEKWTLTGEIYMIV